MRMQKKKKNYKLNPEERWSQAEHLQRGELLEQARTKKREIKVQQGIWYK